MRRKNIHQWTKRKDLPRRFSREEINELDDETMYPAYFYNSVFGKAKKALHLNDLERGIINIDECEFDAPFQPAEKRKHGDKVGMMISGRELKRLRKTGRIIGHHNIALREYLEEREVLA